ncbi:unnamed protein product, partial [Rotaria sordida]
ESQRLVSDRIPTAQLQNEYASDDKIYQDKIAELTKTYKYIRRIRSDGNEFERFRQLTYDLKDQLIKLDYLDFTVEDVRDVVIEMIDNISKEGNEQSLIKNFRLPSNSDYFVAYLQQIIIEIRT